MEIQELLDLLIGLRKLTGNDHIEIVLQADGSGQVQDWDGEELFDFSDVLAIHESEKPSEKSQK